MNLKVLSVRDVAETFDGPHATPKSTKTAEDGPVFLGISSLRNGRLDLTKSAYLSEEDFALWTRRVTPQPDDVVFSYETRLGEAAIVPDGLRCCLGRRLALMRPRRAVVDPRFLLYYFLSPEFQQVIAERTVPGSTVPRILLTEFPDFPVRLPELATQRAIAATLGALDDKIESNRRAADLLLELSMVLFDRMRQDWSMTTESCFGDFSEVHGGATPRTAVPEFWGAPHAWATPTDVTALDTPYLFATSRSITDEGLGSCSATLHPVGTILMTSRATIGAFAINQVPMSTNQGFIAVRPKAEHHRWFLFGEMRSRIGEFIAQANGSTFLELSRGRFKSLPLNIPSDDELREVHSQLDPLHAKAAQLSGESDKLAELRDALLPDLMSGRIRVPEANEAIAEAVPETEVA